MIPCKSQRPREIKESHQRFDNGSRNTGHRAFHTEPGPRTPDTALIEKYRTADMPLHQEIPTTSLLRPGFISGLLETRGNDQNPWKQQQHQQTFTVSSAGGPWQIQSWREPRLILSPSHVHSPNLNANAPALDKKTRRESKEHVAERDEDSISWGALSSSCVDLLASEMETDAKETLSWIPPAALPRMRSFWDAGEARHRILQSIPYQGFSMFHDFIDSTQELQS